MDVSGRVLLAAAAEVGEGRCASCDPDALVARIDEPGRNAEHRQAKRVGQSRNSLGDRIDSTAPCVASRTTARSVVVDPATVPGSYLVAAFVHQTGVLMALMISWMSSSHRVHGVPAALLSP